MANYSILTKAAWLKPACLYAAVCFLIMSIAFYAAAAEKGTSTNSKPEIRAVLKNFAESYKKKDLDAVMALYADTPDNISVHTGVDFIGSKRIREGYQIDFNRYKKFTNVDYKAITISSSDDVGWLSADGFTGIGKDSGAVDVYFGMFTAVLKKINGKWLFVQTHYSSLKRPPEEARGISKPAGK